MEILVVEDEPELLENICVVLQKEGNVVNSAGNGQVGLYYASNFDYDAIILEEKLPYLDGWALLECLRRIKQTPVLMLTTRDQPGDPARGLDTGAEDYIVKPFEIKELTTRLHAIIGAPPAMAGR